STVSDAMSAMLASSHGGAMVTRRGKYIGVISYDTVNDYIRSLNAAAAHDAADDSSPKEGHSGGEIYNPQSRKSTPHSGHPCSSYHRRGRLGYLALYCDIG